MSESKTAQLYDKKESAAFYDERYAHGYMDDWPTTKKQKIQEVLLSLDLPQTGTALDFGCGTGVLTELIGQTLPGWTVCGTDLSTVAITTARKRYGKRQFFAPGDAGFAGKRFDLIVSHHVLEHVYDIAEALDDIGRYLKPAAGMLHILPCGNEDSFCHRLCKMRHEGINAQLGNRFFFEDEGHVRRLTTDELASLCAKQGFELKRDYYTGQHHGAIDYITKNEPHLTPLLVDWSKGIDAAAKRKIFSLGLYLRGVAACRSFAARVEKKRGQTSKNAGEWLRLSLALPPYLIARSVDRRMTCQALEEWNTRKAARNGDQMFLYFTRTDGGEAVARQNTDCPTHGSTPWQTLARPDEQQATLSTTPAVTVLMAVYNAESFLRKAVESILGQTFGDFEFIIINDGSTDGSGELLDEYAQKDPRIRVVHQENRGLTISLNTGLEIVRGRYVARMDADDISEVTRLAKQVEFLEAHTDHVAVGTSGHIIDQAGSIVGRMALGGNDRELAVRFLADNFMIHGSVLFRCGHGLQYNSTLGCSQDYDLWVRLRAFGKIANLSEPLYRWRQHAGGISATRATEQREIARRVADEHLQNLLGLGEHAAVIEAYARSISDPVQRKAVKKSLLGIKSDSVLKQMRRDRVLADVDCSARRVVFDFLLWVHLTGTLNASRILFRTLYRAVYKRLFIRWLDHETKVSDATGSGIFIK